MKTPENERPKSGEAEDTQVEQPITNSLDLTGLFGRYVTDTGSFDLRGVQAKSLSKLLDSLPMPGLLVDDAYAVAYANDSWTTLSVALIKSRAASSIVFFPTKIRLLRFTVC